MLTPCTWDSEVRAWAWPFRCWTRKTDSEAHCAFGGHTFPGEAGKPDQMWWIEDAGVPRPLQPSGPSWVPLLLMDQGLPSSVRFSLNTILRSEWIYRKYKCFLKATNKMSDRKPSLSHILVHGLWVMWQLIPVTLKEGRRWHHPHLFMGVWNTRPEHDSSFGNYQLEEEADLKICHLPPGHFFCLLSSFLLRKFLPLP